MDLPAKAKAILDRTYFAELEEILEVIASPLVPPELAWGLVLRGKSLGALEGFGRRRDLEAVELIRAKRTWGLQDLEEALQDEASEAHWAVLLWELTQDLPPTPEEERAIRKALPRVFQLIARFIENRFPSRFYHGMAKGLAEALLRLAGEPEDIEIHYWLMVAPHLNPTVLEELARTRPQWLYPVFRVAPHVAHLPPPGHPHRKEIAVLSLSAVLEAYPHGISEEEVAKLLPEALGKGGWFGALEWAAEKFPNSPWVSRLTEGLRRIREIPFLRETVKAFLPRASFKALLFLLISLPEEETPLLVPHLAKLQEGPERAFFAKALFENPLVAPPALKRLEALGLLDLAMSGEWWRGTVLGWGRMKGRSFPFTREWGKEERLSHLPIPVARELLKRADSAGKALLLEALGRKLPKEDWRRFLHNRSQSLRKVAAALHAQEWTEQVVQELQKKGFAVPPAERLLALAQKAFERHRTPPTYFWLGGLALIWDRTFPGDGEAGDLFLSSPWGWLSLRNRRHDAPSPSPSTEEALGVLARSLEIPIDAIRYLFSLDGEKAYRTIALLKERGDGVLLNVEELRHLTLLSLEEALRLRAFVVEQYLLEI